MGHTKNISGLVQKRLLIRPQAWESSEAEERSFLGLFQVDYRLSRVRGLFLLLSLRDVDTHAELVRLLVA